jgi:hypothetical protein
MGGDEVGELSPPFAGDSARVLQVPVGHLAGREEVARRERELG